MNKIVRIIVGIFMLVIGIITLLLLLDPHIPFGPLAALRSIPPEIMRFAFLVAVVAGAFVLYIDTRARSPVLDEGKTADGRSLIKASFVLFLASIIFLLFIISCTIIMTERLPFFADVIGFGVLLGGGIFCLFLHFFRR